MAPDHSENSYRAILRRITAFGGVQLFNVFVALARGKLVAMFLGPEGMGISSLYTSSTDTLRQFAGLGLNLSIVKEVSAAKGDAGAMARVMAVAIRLTVITSLLGAALCFLLSPLLSQWTFGNGDYTLGFMLLSLSVALSIAASCYMALLQGAGAVRELAKASVVGGLSGLVFGVPLYYFFGVRGIVPAIIILSITTFIFNYISFRRRGYAVARFAGGLRTPLVRRLLSTGLVLMVGALAGTLTGYIINMYVRYAGSVADVGLFQAANSITNQYMGIVFSALALDYFPRLSAAAVDKERFDMVVNRQIEIVGLIAVPLVIALVGTAPLLIRLLLTESFMPVVGLIKWMGVGILSQALYFPVGYMFIARDNRRLYMWVEVVAGSLLRLGFAVLFYALAGLTGLGVSFVVTSVVTNVIGYVAVRRAYSFRLTGRNIRRCIVAAAVAGVTFAASMTVVTTYTVIPLLFISTAAYAVVTLRRKL
ncbi:MAG: oligosaccharide flippase family protein [Muribaculaceae bacterium]